MTDQAANGLMPSRARTPSIEYRFYFGIIFLMALPWAFLSWVLGLAHPESEDASRGFIGRAWRRASIITPLIFSA